MSFPRYPEYKDSGVEWLGAVPRHWRVMRIKHLLKSLEQGWSPQCEAIPVDSPDEWGVLKVGCVNGGVFNAAENKALPPELEPIPDLGIRAADLLISRANTRELVGSAAVALIDHSNLMLCDKLFRLRFDASVCSPHFIASYLSTGKVRGQIELAASGASSSMLNIGQSTILEMAVALPDSTEQVAICDFLRRETTKIDKLMAEQEKLIALLKEKRQAVIAHAVTKGLDPTVPMKDSGVEWLGEVPAHWTTCALSYRYEIALGKMLDEKRVTGEHLAPYLRNVDVQWGHINIESLPEMDFKGDDLSRYSLRTGDLLVCEGGEVGRAAIWRGGLQECYYQKALHRLRPRSTKDSTEFLYYVFHTAANLGLFAGSEGRSTIAHLTAETLRRYRFAFPPQPEQASIANRLNKIASSFERLIQEAETAISLLKERRTALISAAVTGQIDVRGLVKDEQEQAA
ncbi:restriction endonuclease subunit S [Ectopseudomonas khazarica]|uniref:restriction endonuclease subunit S n=1 Tax=Ectopseudomonas khazarica TaxID=2502979 RepID=UPI001AEF9391|nr:restriction endonuclease subunit S [Pseudomonas khazarica]QTS86220.1 restriction endonuclease subunit S [Pseudomonas khazarica]